MSRQPVLPSAQTPVALFAAGSVEKPPQGLWWWEIWKSVTPFGPTVVKIVKMTLELSFAGLSDCEGGEDDYVFAP